MIGAAMTLESGFWNPDSWKPENPYRRYTHLGYSTVQHEPACLKVMVKPLPGATPQQNNFGQFNV